jgi:hypothetical protein
LASAPGVVAGLAEGSTTPGAGAVVAAAPDAADGQGSGGLTLDDSGQLPFFYMDAYENPDARPGVVLATPAQPAAWLCITGSGRHNCGGLFLRIVVHCGSCRPQTGIKPLRRGGSVACNVITYLSWHIPTTPACLWPLPTPPGEAILFGKVQQEGRWQSAAVVVRGLQRCLFVVPKPEVFTDADGAIAALEAAVKADPARKPELLKLLHVSPQRCCL